MKPITHPLRLSTKGRDSTPDPMAEAQSEKILPLRDPFSNLPKALFIKGRLWFIGDISKAPGLILMSAVAWAEVFGETIESAIEKLEMRKVYNCNYYYQTLNVTC